MHRHEGPRVEFLEYLHRFVRSHVDMTEGIGIIGADGEERDFGIQPSTNFTKAVRVGTVAGVINLSALMLDEIAAVASMLVMDHSRAPVFARGQGHLPIAISK